MVEVLRREGMDSRRIRLDGLRLSRRTDPIRLAVGQFELRHRGPVRIPQGLLLLLQGLVASGTLAASFSALQLARQGSSSAKLPRKMRSTSYERTAPSSTPNWTPSVTRNPREN